MIEHAPNPYNLPLHHPLYTYVQFTVAAPTTQSVKTCEFWYISRTNKFSPAMPGKTSCPACVAEQFEKSTAPKSANGTRAQLPLLSQLSKSSTIHSALVSHSAEDDETLNNSETTLPVVRFSILTAPEVVEDALTVRRIESPACSLKLLKSYAY